MRKILVAICIIFSLGGLSALAIQDLYEPDDTFQQANFILINATRQSHTIDPAGDYDWIKFNATAGNRYRIMTENLANGADTYIYLYDTDGTTLLAQNDDIELGVIRNSKIEWTIPGAGTYFVKTKDWDSQQAGGSYDIFVQELSTLTNISCYNGTWIDCTTFPYSATIQKVRANCTEQVTNITFLLENKEDNAILFNVTTSVKESGFWTANTTYKITDSGTWNLTVLCGSNGIGEVSWTVPWGNLTPSLIYPGDRFVTGKNGVFNVTASVSCQGGECQDITAYLDPERTESRFIITFKDQQQGSAPYDRLANPPFLSSQSSKIVGVRMFHRINGIAGSYSKEAIAGLRADPEVEAIFPDKIYHIFLDQSVPFIGAGDLWAEGFNGTGQTVCVIDTGVDYTHSSIGGCSPTTDINNGSCAKVIGGYDYVNNDADPMDDHGHGTHVAGIIASTHPTYTGVAPEAKIVALKACDAAGSCYTSDIISSIEWCIDNADDLNISVISMSLGGGGPYQEACGSAPETPLIQEAVSHGIFVAIASGNDHYTNGISSPACTPGSVSVGSSTASDTISGFTNRGNLLDILAPGEAITSLRNGGGTTQMGGTSMATPHIAGAVLLLHEYFTALNLSLTPQISRYFLRSRGVIIPDTGSGLRFPRVNLSGMPFGKRLVPTVPGATPFYTLDTNPANSTFSPCLSSIKPNESCNTTWRVNATGAGAWEFFVYYETGNNDFAKTGIHTVHIDSNPPVINNVSINGTDPQAPLTVNATSFSFNLSDDSLLSSFILTYRGADVLINDSINANGYAGKVWLNVTAGMHQITLKINDSLGNQVNASLVFYAALPLNTTQALQYMNQSLPGVESISILYQNASALSNPDAEMITNKTYQLLFQGEDINITLRNLSGLYADWGAVLNISFDDPLFTEIENIYSTTVLDGVTVDVGSFIDSSRYYASISLPKNLSLYTHISYSNTSLSREVLSSCSRDKAPCYNLTSNQILVPHFSSVLGENDTRGPAITLLSPINSSMWSTSSEIPLHITTNEPATCLATLNQELLFNQTNATDFLMSLPALINKNYSLSLFCYDAFDNPTVLNTTFTINDTTAPSVTIHEPAGPYTTTSANTYNVPILISTDEYANVTFTVLEQDTLYLISDQLLNQSTSLILASGTYTINVTAVDINGNMGEESGNFTVFAGGKPDVIASFGTSGSGGGGGGGGPSAPILRKNHSEKENTSQKSTAKHDSPNSTLVLSLDYTLNPDTIEVIITDNQTGLPLEHAEISLSYDDGQSATYQTDQMGKATIRPLASRFSISVQKPGYGAISREVALPRSKLTKPTEEYPIMPLEIEHHASVMPMLFIAFFSMLAVLFLIWNGRGVGQKG